MSEQRQILIIDSTGNRRKDLCELWSGVLGFTVLFYGGTDFMRFKSGGEPKTVSADELSNVKPLACLFHAGDYDKYSDPETKKIIDSSGRVIMFSGIGLASANASWPLRWFWIPRAISGKGSARERVWTEFGDWLATKPSGSDDAVSIELLSLPKRPHFLIALYILCQGFLAGERMRERVPAAVSQTRKREWWSVPLLQSAGDNLVNIVTEEWGDDIPISVLQLVEWIADKPGSDDLDVAEVVAEAKGELETRIAK